MFKKLPNSTRKFIRFEKARIRRQFLDYKAQKEAIANMYSKILNKPLGHEVIAKKVEVLEPVKLEKKAVKKAKVKSKKIVHKKKQGKK